MCYPCTWSQDRTIRYKLPNPSSNEVYSAAPPSPNLRDLEDKMWAQVFYGLLMIADTAFAELLSQRGTADGVIQAFTNLGWSTLLANRHCMVADDIGETESVFDVDPDMSLTSVSSTEDDPRTVVRRIDIDTASSVESPPESFNTSFVSYTDDLDESIENLDVNDATE